MQTHAHNQAIAAIYETVIRAELCDRFLRPDVARHDGFSEVQPEQHQPPYRISPQLTLHFMRAEEILEQQWVRAGRPSPVQFFEDGDRYWMLLSLLGYVERASRVAQDRLRHADGDIYGSLGVKPADRSRFKQWLSQLEHQKCACPIPEILPTMDETRKLLCRPVQSGQGLQASFMVMTEHLDFHWSASAQEMLSSTFGLHQQELQLLGAYLSGTSLAELGEATPGGVVNIRSQLRGIMIKSGAPGMAEMLRLFCFLIGEVAADERIAFGDAILHDSAVQLTSGQRVHYFKMGAETGQPIIFLHGLLDGIAGVQRLQQQFRKRGFRVYAPLRSGYGRTGPVPSPKLSFDTFIDQLEALIEHENLRRPILLGHRGGAAHTHVAARRLRDRVSGAVIVSGMAPVQKLSQLSAMRGHQRLMAITATYCPNFMPMVAKRWERYIQKTGPMALLRQRPDQDCQESDLIESPELTNLLQASSRIVQGQKSAGLMADYYWIVNDWQRHISGNSAPVIYLHGNEDQVTSADHLQKTMAGRSNVQVRLCNGAGSMLLYTRPELVLAALEELADG